MPKTELQMHPWHGLPSAVLMMVTTAVRCERGKMKEQM
jgi:hypothetical protein